MRTERKARLFWGGPVSQNARYCVPHPPWRIRCLQADKNYHLGASSAKINAFQSYSFVIIERFIPYLFKSTKCPIDHLRIEFELNSPRSPFTYMPVDPGFVDCLFRHTRELYLSLFLSEFAKNDRFVCLKICLKSFTDLNKHKKSYLLIPWTNFETKNCGIIELNPPDVPVASPFLFEKDLKRY